MSPTQTAGPGRLSFPALDPEPPPRPWWHWLLVPAVLVVLAGAAGAVAAFWPRSPARHGPGPAIRASLLPGLWPGGKLLVLARGGQVMLADPAGGKPAAVTGPGR